MSNVYTAMDGVSWSGAEMVYVVSSRMKRQVEWYLVLEKCEEAMGYAIMTIFMTVLGGFGQDMTFKVFWIFSGTVLTELASKILRRSIYKYYFESIPCLQVSTSQRTSERFKFGSIEILEGRFRVNFRYVFFTALARLMVLVAQLFLVVGIWRERRAVHHSRHDPESADSRGAHRLMECLTPCFSSLVAHSVLGFLLIFSPLLCRILTSFLSALRCLTGIRTSRSRRTDPCGSGWGDTCSFCSWPWGTAPGNDDGQGHGQPRLRLIIAKLQGLAIERLDRAQIEMEMGVTWYVHYSRHGHFTEEQAQKMGDQCGLPGFWFLGPDKLVEMVQSHMHEVVDEDRHAASAQRRSSSGKQLSMGLQSLEMMSRPQMACTCTGSVHDTTPSCMQDLPHASRCRFDVDACRDFARAEGFIAMLQVLQSSVPDSNDVALAASIVSGFAVGLAVTSWQPCDDPTNENYIQKMLEDEDFRCCSVDLLKCLFSRLRHTGPKRVKNRIEEAAASAICSFARAARDISAHAEYSRLYQPRPVDGPLVIRLANSFTTLCPEGWVLASQVPDFQRAEEVWVSAVKSVLCRQENLDTLIECARTPTTSTSNRKQGRTVIADCIRTLSWLYSRPMITWNRFDKRHSRQAGEGGSQANDVPDLSPFASIAGIEIADRLLSLTQHASRDDYAKSSLSPFSKLHLAKIIVSQRMLHTQDGFSAAAELTLQVLAYWRCALGSKEICWLACEAVETLHDLFDFPDFRLQLIEKIRQSPHLLECLVLMLYHKVSVIRAVRFSEGALSQDFSKFCEKILTNLQNPLRRDQEGGIHVWSAKNEVTFNAWPTSASGLLWKMYSENDSADIMPRSQVFVTVLLTSLAWIMVTGAKQSRHRQGPRAGSPCKLVERLMALCALSVESLCNPAWRPGTRCCHLDVCYLDWDEGCSLDRLQANVNALLAARDATRIMHYLIKTYGAMEAIQVHLITTCFSPLVMLLTGPPLAFEPNLGLEKLEENCQMDIRDHAAQSVIKIICTSRVIQTLRGRGQEDPPQVGDADHDDKLQLVRKGIHKLRDWLARRPGERTEIEEELHGHVQNLNVQSAATNASQQSADAGRGQSFARSFRCSGWISSQVVLRR
ncbi:hypothetical protein CBR_g55423 [Chara braunii]|uniref:Uncharacterized protein n=1 Tax=Chara braunii TaxID=69332 RepID=A0A388K7Q1_CHABU|nr:hypothetical protein CBR_g55423 [Chara braunii]|eukprot:GBG66080.1 hypothetical protein CBR_g55423 [Chara braunii]